MFAVRKLRLRCNWQINEVPSCGNIVCVSTAVTQSEKVKKKNLKWMSAKTHFRQVLPVISHSSQHKTGQYVLNTLRTGDTNLRFYIKTVQDGWRKSAFLTRAWFPCTIHLITQYMGPVSKWSCWRMFIETWPHSELTLRHRASSI